MPRINSSIQPLENWATRVIKVNDDVLFCRYTASNSRSSGYARSDATLDEIVNELHEQEVNISLNFIKRL